MSADIWLRVGGKQYGGWKSVRVTRGIDAIAGAFELAVNERWQADGERWPIGEGDECSVILNGEPVITGFIDARTFSASSGQHGVSLSGRDRTGDLVDSSVMLPAWEFTDVPVLNLARQICQPHGVSVHLQPGLTLSTVTIPKKFSIDPGDTALQALENLCRVAGVLPVSDGLGNLILTRAGASRCTTELVLGKNVLEADLKLSLAGRFRTYKVLGSHKGTDESHGVTVARVVGSATDPDVPRASRVLLVRPEGAVTAAQAKTRAEWEATVRAARADTASVTVQGWTQASGKLWPVNALVKTRFPQWGFAADMLIVRATHTLDVNGGTTTGLELARPDAFKPEAIVGKGAGNNYWPEIVKGV